MDQTKDMRWKGGLLGSTTATISNIIQKVHGKNGNYNVY